MRGKRAPKTQSATNVLVLCHLSRNRIWWKTSTLNYKPATYKWSRHFGFELQRERQPWEGLLKQSFNTSPFNSIVYICVGKLLYASPKRSKGLAQELQ